MRRLILAVLIVLLPLRGWLGDAMAVEATTGTQTASHSAAASDPSLLGSTGVNRVSGLLDLSGGPGHCPDHASASDVSTGTDVDAAAPDSACTVCQVCHSVAMNAEAFPFVALSLPVLAPEAPVPWCISALPAPGLKPPIS